MRTTRLWVLSIIAVLFPLVPGCTCFQHNTQQAVLAVTDAGSGQGLSGGTVTIAPAEDRSGWILCQERSLTPEECLDEYAERSTSPTSSFLGEYVSSTAVDGGVTLVVDSFSPRQPAYPCQNPPLDEVTGVEFYVRVETEGSTEILTVEFTPGNTVSGEFFEVTVVSIGEPVPVEDFD